LHCGRRRFQSHQQATISGEPRTARLTSSRAVREIILSRDSAICRISRR
jgi:hypothetical protein